MNASQPQREKNFFVCASLAKIPGSTIKRSPFFFFQRWSRVPFSSPPWGDEGEGGHRPQSPFLQCAPERYTLLRSQKRRKEKSTQKLCWVFLLVEIETKKDSSPKRVLFAGHYLQYSTSSRSPMPHFFGWGTMVWKERGGIFLGGCHPPTLLTRRLVPGNMRMNA